MRKIGDAKSRDNLNNPLPIVLIPIENGLGDAILLTRVVYTIKPFANCVIISNYSPIVEWCQMVSIPVIRFSELDQSKTLTECLSMIGLQCTDLVQPTNRIMCLHSYLLCTTAKIRNLKKSIPSLMILRQSPKWNIKEWAISKVLGAKLLISNPHEHELNQMRVFFPYLSVKHDITWDETPLSLPERKSDTLTMAFSKPRSKPLLVLQTQSQHKLDPKNWPLPYWKRLIELLCERYEIVLVGSNSERDIEAICYKMIEEGKIKSIIGKTTLSDLVWIIQAGDCFIGPDSASGHIAGVLNKKSVILWGPTSFDLCHPLGDNSHYMSIHTNCSPCRGPEKLGLNSLEKSIKKCGFQTKCMRELTPESVASFIENLVSIQPIVQGEMNAKN